MKSGEKLLLVRETVQSGCLWMKSKLHRYRNACLRACAFTPRATLLDGPSYTWLGTSLVPLRSTITTDTRVCSGRRCYGQPSNKLPLPTLPPHNSLTHPHNHPPPPPISFIPLRFFRHCLQTVSMFQALILTQTLYNLADSSFQFQS